VVNRHGFHPPNHQLFIAGLFCETKILTELQNQGKKRKNTSKKQSEKTIENKKQIRKTKINKIKTTGKQRLNRRLRKKKQQINK
jgi:hypothetical protein